ncbi:hypothetical protein [Nocardioides sp.]|uniref:hypothetical protein n=1 Tax=Nocardioides sp. TaxID=35761 RepID=UPI00378302CD
MYESTIDRDYVKTELEFRLGRIQADIAGRRRRRLLSRRGSGGAVQDSGWTTIR